MPVDDERPADGEAYTDTLLVRRAARVGVQYPLIEANLLVVKPVTKLTNGMALDNTLQSFPRSYSTHLPLPYL